MVWRNNKGAQTVRSPASTGTSSRGAAREFISTNNTGRRSAPPPGHSAHASQAIVGVGMCVDRRITKWHEHTCHRAPVRGSEERDVEEVECGATGVGPRARYARHVHDSPWRRARRRARCP
eukprot:7379652-Prymnesium_polylepis.1